MSSARLCRVALVACGLCAAPVWATTTRLAQPEPQSPAAVEVQSSQLVLPLQLARDGNDEVTAYINWTTRTLELSATGWPRLAAAQLSHTLPHTLAQTDIALRRRLREAVGALPLGWPLGAPLAAPPPASPGGPRAASARKLQELSLPPTLLRSQARSPTRIGQAQPHAADTTQAKGAPTADASVPNVAIALAQASNDALTAALDSAVGHYRSERTTFGSDGRIEVSAVLALDGGADSLGAVWPRLRRFVPTIMGESRHGLSAQTGSRAARVVPRQATGLIVEAHDLPVEPCLWPRLYDAEGHLLYGPELLRDEVLQARGVAAFGRSLDAARRHERVGEQPVVVRALRLLRPHAADVVLDVHELPAADALSELFTEARVFIVVR